MINIIHRSATHTKRKPTFSFSRETKSYGKFTKKSTLRIVVEEQVVLELAEMSRTFQGVHGIQDFGQQCMDDRMMAKTSNDRSDIMPVPQCIGSPHVIHISWNNN